MYIYYIHIYGPHGFPLGSDVPSPSSWALMGQALGPTGPSWAGQSWNIHGTAAADATVGYLYWEPCWEP